MIYTINSTHKFASAPPETPAFAGVTWIFKLDSYLLNNFIGIKEIGNLYRCIFVAVRTVDGVGFNALVNFSFLVNYI